jgi:sugar lactone lactonase YvrE
MSPRHRWPALALPLLLAGGALLLGCVLAPVPTSTWTRVGGGAWSYAWDPRWSGLSAVDGAGRVYVNTDGPRAVLIFEADGRPVGAWGSELAGGLHGMALDRDGRSLWLVHTGRHELLRATLDGVVTFRRGWPQESGQYEKAEHFNPTGVAVGPDGDLYVADGYGLGFVHRFRADGTWVRCWGGGGSEPGRFHTPHGIALDTRTEPNRLIVADRENGRLQIFDLDGQLLEIVQGMLRRPCGAAVRGDLVAVPDLAGRVTLLDRENRLLAQLGDQPDEGKRANNGVPRGEWRDGQFISPHGLAWGANGDLYVQDWLAQGRFTRLAKLR